MWRTLGSRWLCALSHPLPSVHSNLPLQTIISSLVGVSGGGGSKTHIDVSLMRCKYPKAGWAATLSDMASSESGTFPLIHGMCLRGYESLAIIFTVYLYCTIIGQISII